jgi:hypothetical protein
MNMKNLILVATWAFCIIIGSMMLTPHGPVPIGTKPAVSIVVGVIGVLLGVLGFVMNWKEVFNKKTT